MYPVGSDTFDITDFENTFTIIDQNPGTLTVANQASRPTGWGANQHGRRVMQADQGIEWWWNQPSSIVAGVWTRVAPKGWLGGTYHGGSVSCNDTSTPGVLVASVNLLVPGGRPVQVFYSFLYATNTNNSDGQALVQYYENGTFVNNKTHNGTGYNGGDPSNPPSSGMMYYLRNIAPTTQQNVTFSIYVTGIAGRPIGQTTLWNTTLDIYEV
jgi:hypothetical protein